MNVTICELVCVCVCVCAYLRICTASVYACQGVLLLLLIEQNHRLQINRCH